MERARGNKKKERKQKKRGKGNHSPSFFFMTWKGKRFPSGRTRYSANAHSHNLRRVFTARHKRREESNHPENMTTLSNLLVVASGVFLFPLAFGS